MVRIDDGEPPLQRQHAVEEPAHDPVSSSSASSLERLPHTCWTEDRVTLDCLMLFTRDLDSGTEAWHVRATVKVAARGVDGRGRAAVLRFFTATAEASQ